MLPPAARMLAESLEATAANRTACIGVTPAWAGGWVLVVQGETVRFERPLLMPSPGVGAPARDASSPQAASIAWIKRATGLSRERIGRLLGVTRETVDNWENDRPIADARRRHLLAVQDVLRRAALRYPSPEQLAAWLDAPRGEDARTPAQLLEAGEIDRARYLAVSVPSDGVRPAHASSSRPVPKAFRAGAERRQVAVGPDANAGEDIDAFLVDADEDAITGTYPGA